MNHPFEPFSSPYFWLGVFFVFEIEGIVLFLYACSEFFQVPPEDPEKKRQQWLELANFYLSESARYRKETSQSMLISKNAQKEPE